MKIEMLKGDYDRSYFYSLMGKYFAEVGYKKQMPYLVNRDTNVWFLAFENQELVGFGAINETKSKIVFEHSFVEQNTRGKGIWKKINEARANYCKDKNKPIEVITKESHLMEFWLAIGFTVCRENGRYKYLRKDVQK